MATRITRSIRPLSKPFSHPVSHPVSHPFSYLGPSPATSTSRALRRSSSTFSSGPSPSPPRLPPHEQAEFERLQRTANTQAGFTATSSPDVSSGAPTTSTAATAATTSASALGPQASSSAKDTVGAEPAATSTSTPTPTPLRKGAPPDFEGDVNPRTGEIGGPKNEPLRWGAGGDYSFNGRVTDF
ncbi:DUF1674-domain-containing protein [Nemania serpens]|nr:DUF1674-domain-containing protein [Nemania serpens]